MVGRRRPRPANAADRPVPQCNDHSTKRRRGAATAGAISSAWPWMPEDLIVEIADRVLAGDLLNYVHFRAVCTQWRSCTDNPRGRGVADARFHPRRWTMLPEGHGKLRGHARFFNRGTGAFVRARVPELRDHLVLDSPDNGLLLLQRDADTAVRLLHPFTGDVCELPPLTSLIPQLDRLTDNQPRFELDLHKVQCFRRLTAAVSVAPKTGAVTVVLALEHLRRFAHASGGDRSWVLTDWSWSKKSLVDRTRILPFHGSLYLAIWGFGSGESSILRLDPPPPAHVEESSSSLPPPQTIATIPAKLMVMPHLVECESEILVVGDTDTSCAYTAHLLVFRLADLLHGGPAAAAPLTSIGVNCLFLGMQSLAVSAKGMPSITANSVVLTSSMSSRVMQYDLSDGSTSLAACDVDSPPPCPHTIVHLLLTCCYRHFWNKGHIYSWRSMPPWGRKRRWRLGA